MQMQRGTQYCKRWSEPQKKQSEAQKLRRNTFKTGVIAWKNIQPAEKQAWNEIAKKRAITGWNAFIAAWLAQIQPEQPTTWDAGASTWDAGASTWDQVIKAEWDAGASTWDGGATTWRN